MLFIILRDRSELAAEVKICIVGEPVVAGPSRSFALGPPPDPFPISLVLQLDQPHRCEIYYEAGRDPHSRVVFLLATLEPGEEAPLHHHRLVVREHASPLLDARLVRAPLSVIHKSVGLHEREFLQLEQLSLLFLGGLERLLEALHFFTQLLSKSVLPTKFRLRWPAFQLFCGITPLLDAFVLYLRVC